MHPIGYYLGISKQAEVILLTLIGICYTVFDPALLDLHSNLQKLWLVALDPTKVSPKLQIYIKYILSLIVLVRTFSVHIYLAFYIVMLWPAFLEERPALLLPWLIVGAIKCLGMGIVAFVSGLYVCYAYGLQESICIDFIIAQLIDYAPSFYMWYCVYSFYCDLKLSSVTTGEIRSADIETEIAMRRRKVRTLAEDVVLKNPYTIDEDRNLISVSTIEDIVQQLTTDISRRASRSFDSLLNAMAAEAEKEELMSSSRDPFTNTIGLNIKERTMKLLKITDADITEAKARAKMNIIRFTSSMLTLNIQGIPEHNKVLKKATPSESKTLQSVETPLIEIKMTDVVKQPQGSNLMISDMSETQIGAVLDYSSTSLKTNSNLAPVSSPQKMLKQGKSKSPTVASVKDVLKNKENKSAAPVQSSVIGQIKHKVKNVSHEKVKPINVNVRKDLLDFSCQASTLSRNILKTHNLKFINERSRNANKEVSRKTPFTRATPKTIPTNKTILQNKEENTATGESLKKTRQRSPFRKDGYTLAYEEKMRSVENTGKQP